MIVLLQARIPGDEMLEHEFECFVRQSPFDSSRFQSVNLPETRVTPEVLAQAEMLMVGGAGDFSLAEPDFDWHDHFLEAMRTAVQRKIPTFASCFGCHALVKAFGGRLRKIPDASEVGTFDITLTSQGQRDAVFGEMPETFAAQLGHQDSVVELPDELVCLARSERCAVQAVRVPGEPIYATQFHPELTAEDNIERYATYIQNYESSELPREEAVRRARQIHRPSPEASKLLTRFVRKLDSLRDAGGIEAV